jgi:hypothetical protein
VAFADVADVLTVSPAADSAADRRSFAADCVDPGQTTLLPPSTCWINFRGSGRFHRTGRIPSRKNLPVAAGGNGSADTAAPAPDGCLTWQFLWRLEELPFGSAPTCPVPAQETNAWAASGDSGTVATPACAVVLVNPRLPAPTARVFEAWDWAHQSFGTAIADLRDFTSWRNDLTLPALAVVRKFPPSSRAWSPAGNTLRACRVPAPPASAVKTEQAQAAAWGAESTPAGGCCHYASLVHPQFCHPGERPIGYISLMRF